MRTLNVIGCGRVGKTLAKAWHTQGVLAITLKPSGNWVTLSPWLIQTLSMPWPSGVVKSAMSLSKAV